MLTLINRQIAIDPIDDPDFTSGGLVVPEIAKGRADQGIVKYVAKDCTAVEVMDYVLIPKYTGTLFSLEGEGRLIVMSEDDIIAKIDPPNNVQNMEIPGLFFRSRSSRLVLEGDASPTYEYFPATYEYITTLITRHIKNTPFRIAHKYFNVKEKDGTDGHRSKSLAEERDSRKGEWRK